MFDPKVTIVIALVGSAGCTALEESPTNPTGTLVRAANGGIVSLGADVSLVIPPGSLTDDTWIDLAPELAPPDAEADGFAASGAAVRFSPPGTQFDLGKPAILTMRFDPAMLAAQALDGRTLELAYYDEELGRYFSTGGEADWSTGTITSRVEHFTLYLPMAAALAVGNNPPTVALQSAVPNPIRAGAPVYLRATIRDYDVGGSVAGAQLLYRQAGAATFTDVPMKAEATLDTFGALIPAGAFVTGVGPDLEYRVVATDNFAASTQSALLQVDVTRTYTPGTLSMTPGSQSIAAGFDKLFAVKGIDDTAANFALVPQSTSATNGVGLTATGTAGVTFSARTVGLGSVNAAFGAETANALVSVFNGPLTSVSIRDDLGMPIDGALVVAEGSRIQLDALGLDAWGNQILVTPTWAADANAGFISSGGLLDTLDGYQGSAVTATIGGVIGAQSLYVVPRVWNTAMILGLDIGHSTGFPKLTSFHGVPYVAYFEDAGAGFVLRVAHRSGSSWLDDGSPTPLGSQPASLAIAAGLSRIQVAWTEGSHIYSAHLEGTTWVQDGGALEVDAANGIAVGFDPEQLSLAFDGDTPWLAFYENAASGPAVHVRHWDGSAWILDGGQVHDLGYFGDQPSIAFLDGTPYVAFQEWTGWPYHIYVRRWDGAFWQPVGGSLNYDISQGSMSPSLAMVGGKPTVAYRNYVNPTHLDLYVTQWDGTTWNQLYDPAFNNSSGGLLAGGYDVATTASFAADGDVPYVAWVERTTNPLLQPFRRRTAHYNPHSGRWSLLGTWNASADIDLAIVGTTPYMAQEEVFSPTSNVRIVSLD